VNARSPRLPPLSLHAWLRYDAIEHLFPHDAETVLEIGAGQGSIGTLLARQFAYVGLEPDTASYTVASRRLGEDGLVLNQSAELYEPVSPFDVVCAFEVLEHLENDRGALNSWKRLIRKDGWLVVSVPAGRNRFGPTDVKAGHFRRYDRDDLTRLLLETGFVEPRTFAYGFPLGYALEIARNVYAARSFRPARLDERTAASGRWLQPPDWAAQLTRIVSLPFRHAQRPFRSTGLGTGLVARARLASPAS
jgi:SAM-dependent methyltransferase